MKFNSRLSRFLSVTLCFTTLNICAPFSAYALVGEPLRKHLEKQQQAAEAAMDAPLMIPSRPLSKTEIGKLQGRAGKNPYLAGQSKMDVIYKGVNLMTGSYTMSVTDLNFEGGYGIPVNVTRTYNANSLDEGPFGLGWDASVDLRTTAGGLMKSSGGPSRSVPRRFMDRPSGQLDDPNLAVQPVEAVVSEDASGKLSTCQRDVDGLITLSPNDKNQIDTEYENVTFAGQTFKITKKQTITTPDGTVYVYENKGSYTSGMKPWNNPSATAEPTNILKVTTATDRQGNVTTYNYNNSQWVTFAKANGPIQERPLTSVAMPNGRTITFNWNYTSRRITSVTDGVRTVNYGYTDGLLTSVTTPAGYETVYGYGNAFLPSGSMQTSASTDLLTTVTDPRGLTTTIHYAQHYGTVLPYYTIQEGPVVSSIDHPNGTETVFDYNMYTGSGSVGGIGNITPDSGNPSGESWFALVEERSSDPGGEADGFLYRLFYSVDFGSQTNTISVNTWFPKEDTSVYMPVSGLGHIRKDYKVYDRTSQDLMYEDHYTMPADYHKSTSLGRHWVAHNDVTGFTRTSHKFNALGSPLETTTYEINYVPNVGFTPGYLDWANPYRVATVKYAYWNRDKYYQQKAVQDQGGRYSFTDYYDSSAAAGKRGQTKKVYAEAFTDFAENTNISVPSTVPTNAYWRYRIEPTNWDTEAGEFDFDTKGRAVTAWKLQRTDTTPWTYVRTDTTYGADTSPWWGMAYQLTEDVGGINRTTTTAEYDSIGRAKRVIDAMGREFTTTYDNDGRVLAVDRTDNSQNIPVVTYSYGTSGITNGQVVGVVDELSGVEQTFSYGSTGVAKGQITGTYEENGSDNYSVGYGYNTAGERETSTYITPQGTTKWGYYDYTVGGQGRAFQTMNKLDGSGNRTGEEFHYEYDTDGRLLQAAFAQSLQSSQTEYSSLYPAARRARAWYVYDSGGRLLHLEHYWDAWNSGSYSAGIKILANSCDYETTGLNRGYKTNSRFYEKDSSANDWSLEREEVYGYDAARDYLTSADYGDGLANEEVSWSYDAAGNRASDSSNPGSWTYDNLSALVESPQGEYANNLLGSRTDGPASEAFTWDVRNRLIGIDASSNVSYQYRADDLRVAKHYDNVTTRYRRDGRFVFQQEQASQNTTTTRYLGAGARGVDYEKCEDATFPIYNAHGDRVADLRRDSASFSILSKRSYDAWGVVRNGFTSGSSAHRYLGNIGHSQDDESSMIYMNARYFDPLCGRFLSEDDEMDGSNWYLYCQNNPTNYSDPSGNAIWALVAAAFLLLTAAANEFWEPNSPQEKCIKGMVVAISIMCSALSLICAAASADTRSGVAIASMYIAAAVGGWALAMAAYQINLLFLINEGDNPCPDGDGHRPSEQAGKLGRIWDHVWG